MLNRTLSWGVDNPLKLATLLGGAIYVFVFESYRSVLRPFGITPADVGIGYTDVIWPVAQNVLFLVFVLGIILLISLPIRGVSGLLDSPERLVGSLLMATILITLVLSGLALSEMSGFQRSLRAGESHAPFFSARLQVLAGLRAHQVEVAWKSDGGARPELPSKLLYLGSADGIAVFFAPVSGKTVRIPSSDIVIFETVRLK